MKLRICALTWLFACDRPDSATPIGDADTAPSIDTASEPETDINCEEDVDVFTQHVWEPVLGKYCVSCHVADGQAGYTLLVLDPDDMLESLRQTSQVADLLLLKPTDLHENGHFGGELVLPDTEAWEALAFWVDWTHGICDTPATQCEDEPLPRRLWRLDHDQYKKTITDLLGISTDLTKFFAADTHVDGYSNDAASLRVSGLLADHYRETAETLGAATDVVSLLDCSPEEGMETQCAAQGIESFGLKAFRRPLTEDELFTYLSLWASIAEESGFYEGMRWTVTAMLQSPHFLYRSELGILNRDGHYSLTDWEVASELSYLLWGTMPDEELFAAAEAGELHTAEQINAQLQRMLIDDRSMETVADFFNEWLQLSQLETVSRDGIDADLREAMAEQTSETIKELAREEASLAEVMVGTETWMPPLLAEHYGIKESGWLEQDGAQYGGLLTHGSVLTTYALADGSSPVHRGVLVRDRLLCDELPPPPANLDTSPPATDSTGTTREKYEVHSTLPECASCHDLIDPIGFGFEHYDHLGRWRDTEDGQTIDASGFIDEATFDGAQDLSAVLLDDSRFRACYTESWRRWGMGTEACADDPGDIGMIEPLLDLTGRNSFTIRIGDGTEGETTAIGSRMSDEEVASVADAFGDVVLGEAEAIEWGAAETLIWLAGFCQRVTVTNTTPEPITWEIRMDVAGTITTHWTSEYTIDGDDTVFTGYRWNAELAGYDSTTFGFCVDR